MKRNAYITGYRSYELGIFSDQDPKVEGLSCFLRKRLLELIDDGYEWFLFSGQLGVEYYAFLEAVKLKNEGYAISISVMFPYQGFGDNWSEKNILKLQTFKEQADFVGYTSQETYHSPQQLKKHTQFLLYATQTSIILYDDEVASKSKFFVNDALQYQQDHDYTVRLYSLYDLQESMYEEAEEDIFCE